MRKLMFVLLLLAIALTVCQKQNSALRIGIIKPSIDHYPLSYALDKELLDSMMYQTISFSAGWELQEALIAGKVDAAILPFTYIWNAASNGYPVRTISFFERESDAILTQPDIDSVEQLQNCRIGLLKGSSLDVLWRDFAVQESLSCEAIYYRSPNEAVAALQTRDVSAVVLYAPIVEKLSEDFPVLHRFGERYPNHPCCDLAVNTANLNASRKESIKQLISDLHSVLQQSVPDDPKVRSYVKELYGLQDEQVSAALSHTRFKMGLDREGIEFQRKMAVLSLHAGYLKRIPSEVEVFQDINEH